MNLFLKIDLNLFSVFICLIMYISASKRAEKRQMQSRLFGLLVLSTLVLLILESIGMVVDAQAGTPFLWMNLWINSLLFLLTPVPAVMWSFYASFQIFHDMHRLRREMRLATVLLAINALLALSSPFTGLMFSVSPENVYQRGPLFIFLVLTCYAPLFYAFALIVIYRKRIPKEEFMPLALFMLPPMIGGALQSIIYGVSLTLSSVTVSLVIIHTSIQHRKLHMDYLTEVFNRRQMDQYMEDRINAARKGKGFSCILLDIDGFKSINDTYGHVEGDEALAAAARLLKASVRVQDFVARYAGDEFIVILDIDNLAALEHTMARIESQVTQYNRVSGKPYKIEFSAGYAVYPPESEMTRDRFLAHVDALMYQRKNTKRNNLEISSI